VHLSGRDVDASVLGIYGIQEAQEAQQPVLKVEPCPRCQEQNDPAARFCRKCGLPLSESFLVEEQSLEERVKDLEEQLRVLAEVKDLLADIRAVKLLAQVLRERAGS